jgi:hypothetical protein
MLPEMKDELSNMRMHLQQVEQGYIASKRHMGSYQQS